MMLHKYSNHSLPGRMVMHNYSSLSNCNRGRQGKVTMQLSNVAMSTLQACT